MNQQVNTWFTEVYDHINSTTGLPTCIQESTLVPPNNSTITPTLLWLYAYYQQSCIGDYSESYYKRLLLQQQSTSSKRFWSNWFGTSSSASNQSLNNLSLQQYMTENGGRIHKQLNGVSEVYAKLQYLKHVVLLSDDKSSCHNTIAVDQFWSDWILKHRESLQQLVQHYDKAVQIAKEEEEQSQLSKSEEIIQAAKSVKQVPVATIVNNNRKRAIIKEEAPIDDGSEFENMAPLRFLSSDEQQILEQEEQVIKMGDLNDKCSTLQTFIAKEIRYLKYSLRESMHRLANLQHATLSDESADYDITNELIDEHISKLIAASSTEKDLTSINFVLSRVDQSFKSLERKITETNEIIHLELSKRYALRNDPSDITVEAQLLNRYNVFGVVCSVTAICLYVKYGKQQ
jgi:molybdopterin converting factor small subunit